MHLIHIPIVDNSINGQIALHAMLCTNLCNLLQVIYCKRIGRMGAHIQSPDAKIYRIGTCLNRSSQRITRAHRSHYFKVFEFHAY